jgi:predicted membrane-bound dolichyl-phosphate-mannose-protein mannosyltransferase
MSSEIVVRAKQLDPEIIFFKPIEEMTELEKVLVWVVLDRIEKDMTEARKKKLRTYLMESAESGGTLTKKGHYEIKYEELDVKVTKQKRKGSAVPNAEALEAYIEAHPEHPQLKNIIEYKPVVREDFLSSCITLGLIPEEDMKTLIDVSPDGWSLRVTIPDELKRITSRR